MLLSHRGTFGSLGSRETLSHKLDGGLSTAFRESESGASGNASNDSSTEVFLPPSKVCEGRPRLNGVKTPLSRAVAAGDSHRGYGDDGSRSGISCRKCLISPSLSE